MIENLFLLFSAGLVLSGLAMVGTAVRAYVETDRQVMIHLSLGFTLIVAATVATVLGAMLSDFQNPQTLLMVNNGFTMVGYLLVIYSVVSYS